MVAFMSYFFTLYLRASMSELPWMIGAVVVGTVCTFVMSTYVLPDRPERVLRATIRALRARMAIVVDTTAEAVRTGRLDERRRRRMRARTIRLNETALMVQGQIEDKANPAMLWPRGHRANNWPPGCSTPNSPSNGSPPRGGERRSHASAESHGDTGHHPRRTGRRARPARRGPSAYRRPAGFDRPRARPNGSSTSSPAPPPTTTRETPPCAALPWR